MNRQEAESLLPWHMAGTLSADEAQAVQAFIDNGEFPEAELRELRLVAAEVAAVADNEPSYNPKLLDNVLAQLDEVPQEAIQLAVSEVGGGEPRDGWLDRLRTALQWHSTPTTARWALGAQFALVTALAVLLVAEPGPTTVDSPAAYGTVADNSSALGAELPVADFTLGFAADANVAAITAELQNLDLRIVDGPTAIGLYEVAAADGVDLEVLEQTLKTTAGVVFAERLLGAD